VQYCNRNTNIYILYYKCSNSEESGKEADFQRTPQVMTEVSIAKSHKTPTCTWPQVPSHACFYLSKTVWI